MKMTVERLKQGLIEHDKGVLKHGAHKPEDREFCALEFVSVMHNEPMHDQPTHMPDLRPLNDARWSSDEIRTEHMLPVLAALWDWHQWSRARKVTWSEHIALKVVQQIVAELPRLPEDIKQRCRNASTLEEARTAAAAARYDAAAAAAAAADAAARYAAARYDAAADAAARYAAARYAAARYAAAAAAADAAAAAARSAAAAAADAAAAARSAAAAAAAADAAAADDIPLITLCHIFVETAEATEAL